MLTISKSKIGTIAEHALFVNHVNSKQATDIKLLSI